MNNSKLSNNSLAMLNSTLNDKMDEICSVVTPYFATTNANVKTAGSMQVKWLV